MNSKRIVTWTMYVIGAVLLGLAIGDVGSGCHDFATIFAATSSSLFACGAAIETSRNRKCRT